MNISEHIAQANKFKGKKLELTLAEADKTPSGSSAKFGICLIKRLAESQNKAKSEEKPATPNPNVLNS